MNCDEAFDALTDADARESDDLQQHLNMCARCRQMREVLAPALALFDAPPRIEPGMPIAGEQGEAAESLRKQFLSVEAVQIARETAQRLATANRSNQSTPRRDVKWLLLQVAAVAACAAVFFTLFAPIAAGPERRQTAPGAVAPKSLSQCVWNNKSAVDKMKIDSRTVVSKCVACHFDKSIDEPSAQFWNIEFGRPNLARVSQFSGPHNHAILANLCLNTYLAQTTALSHL